MNTTFSKYVVSGNDFILCDNRDQSYDHVTESEWEMLCHRKFKIGADGVLLVEKPSLDPSLPVTSPPQFKMRYLNSDGKEVSMCGNGARAILCYFIYECLDPKEFLSLNHSPFEVHFQTQKGFYSGFVEISKNYQISSMNVSLKMTELYDWNRFQFLEIQELTSAPKLTPQLYVNTGVPHMVFELEENVLPLKDLAVKTIGSAVRHHERFQSSGGTNANFYQFNTREKKYYLRTFERGVEDETLACGTGAVATALAIIKQKGLEILKPKKIHDSWVGELALVVPGGELKIEFHFHSHSFSFSHEGIVGENFFHGIYLKGPVHRVYRGNLW